jgi:hypothetical protein
MAGKDINTWKMKRKDKYEKPTAVRMADKEMEGVSGGQGKKDMPMFSCNDGYRDYGRECVGGCYAFGDCDSGGGVTW